MNQLNFKKKLTTCLERVDIYKKMEDHNEGNALLKRRKKKIGLSPSGSLNSLKSMRSLLSSKMSLSSKLTTNQLDLNSSLGLTTLGLKSNLGNTGDDSLMPSNNLITVSGLFSRVGNLNDEFEQDDMTRPEYTTLDGLIGVIDNMVDAFEKGNVCCGGEVDPYLKALDILEVI